MAKSTTAVGVRVGVDLQVWAWPVNSLVETWCWTWPALPWPHVYQDVDVLLGNHFFFCIWNKCFKKYACLLTPENVILHHLL